MMRFFTALACLTHAVGVVKGEASDDLLGATYKPTTDVDSIIDLTPLLEAISLEPTKEEGKARYQQMENGMSLESLGGGGSSGGTSQTFSKFFNARTNPLYSIYMYAYWRSQNGSGSSSSTTADLPNRGGMTFLDEPVDYYGHTIIQNELSKESKYDAELTAETVRVVNVWMATVQALYDAVQTCDDSDGTTVDTSDPEFVNPVDQAAAFWFGSLETVGSSDGGTLYAWAQRTNDLYIGGVDVNAGMIEGLKDLQTMLNSCLTSGAGSGGDDIVGDSAKEMRVKVDDVVRIMTIPLVQNLIVRASDVASDASDADPNEVDYMIMYGIATLPPIRVCDESAFNDLWGKVVDNAKQMNASVLNGAVQSIYDRLICLGITCDQIGVQSNPKVAELPTCTPDEVSEDMKVDLDVRTIGTLIEMDAKPAAYDVYNWGRHVKDEDDIGYYSMQTKSIEEYHEKNEVGNSFNSYFAVVAGTNTNYADEHEYKDMMALGDFAEATPTQRRIIAEASMVLINLHAFAINSMYEAVDYCRDPIANQDGEVAWDTARASLTGWSEGAENVKGVLFTEIPKYMCEMANKCDANGNSEINNNLILLLEAGKVAIENSSCDDAESKIGQIEKLIKTALLDVTAYFADLISKDTTNKGNLAEGYGVAVAVVPWANKLSPSSSSTIERNMGKWNQPTPFPDGINMVMDALRQIVSAAGIDCDLLTQDICGSSSPGTGTEPSSPGMTSTLSSIGTGSTTSSLSSNSDASGPLLGNQYVPTTNVDHITNLTGHIELIASNNIKETGETLYKKLTTNGISLESLGLSGDDNDAKIRTNPLYSIFMYAYWRSKNGSGAESTDDPRDQMTFLDKKVDDYGHTIIQDELTKSSDYDGKLTAETISVMNMWMATVQALYDAVEMCDEADDDDLNVSGPNPIDKAAAFWFGNSDDMSNSSGVSLYAWTKRTKDNFVFDANTTPFDVNNEMVSSLKLLQSLLQECLAPDNQDIETSALKMRILVDDLVKYMTVPLVQNLIHHAGVVATSTGEADPNKLDYIILYALVALPPIRVCDEIAFNDMWVKLVDNGKDMNTSILYNALNSLYDRLICLGIKCDYIGFPSVLSTTTESWPSCQDPIMRFKGYQGSEPTQFVEEMKVDLDVRTIGTLIEMDARPAAYDVYHWGRHVKNTSGDYYSMQTKSTEEYHEENEVGKSFNSYFAAVAGGITNYADEHEYKDMMALGDFAGATPSQRRIIAEASMVLINLHAFALNCMHRAVDYCRNASDGDTSDLAELHWDRVWASLTGWAEETDDAEGFLFMEIARYLCEEAGTCVEATGDSAINSQLITELEAGKVAIGNSSCDDAESKIAKVQTLLLTILFDITAYFADLISKDTANKDNLAEGYGVAVALVPLVNKLNSVAASTVERNMGKWNVSPSFPDGKDAVMEALKTLVAAVGTGDSAIDCSLLTQDICGGDSSPGTGTAPSSPDTKATPSSIGTGSSTSSSLTTFNDDEFLGDDDDEFNSSSDSYFCGTGIYGGVPSVAGTKSSPLLGGEYTPTSNVDHITKLTDLLKQIEDSPDKATGLQYYRQLDAEISLKCLSSGTKWLDITDTNPLYVIFMYGLWVSDDGDNDNDGYSNKVFDDGDLLHYGDTIIEDEFSKSSGFDAKLSAETIRVMSMWMAMATELYRAANSCRVGYAKKAPQDFNPVDHAAAFWYGTAQNPDLTDNASLYAWAKKAENLFIEQSMGTNDAIQTKLTTLQQKFNLCKSLPEAQQETEGIAMKHMADDITRWMTVPIVQYFIHHLATESGMGVESDDARNYMVLYALTVFPFISICDEDTFDDLYSDFITNIDSYDTATFMSHIKTVQDHFTCLGITCDMVGKSALSTSGWPECKVPSATNTEIAGYTPTSDESLEMAKIDLDISTILSFIIMEANDAALDIYENGRNAKDETMNLPISVKTVSIPESHPDSIATFDHFSTDYGKDYTSVTKNAITGKEEFMWASVLKSSAAASLAIATIDMHMSILDNMYQAQCQNDQVPQQWNLHWDNAVALTVGWSEGTEDGGSSIDGYLFFQLADELCAHFDNCDTNGKSIVNKKLMEEFKYGQASLSSNQCSDAKAAMESIQIYLQAILVDNLAFHSKFADSNRDETHCLMSHVAKNALVPLIRPNSPDAAEKIEANVDATAEECFVTDATAVYAALKIFVDAKGIDCSLLGSSVCKVGSDENQDIDELDDFENNSEYTSNPTDELDTPENESYTILNGEYTPLANLEALHQKVPISEICNSTDKNNAKMKYGSDDSAGYTIKSMSISAKFAMAEELQFNQFVYALQDNVDKTSGDLLFDGKPATEYANTISIDALDTSTILGCRAVKVLNIWMWVVHKLNDSVEACKGTVTRNYGVLDEAAVLWESGLLFEMAENLGPKFGHTAIDGMTVLNREIVDRLKKAQGIIKASDNKCNSKQTHDLRIIVKETISYMTAVLLQSLLDDMLAPTESTDSKQKHEIVELMAFAVLPQIKTCGHEAAYDRLYKDLVTNGLDESMMPKTINVLQDHYNCLGLTCGDVGRHTSEDSKYPSCSDNLDIAGYVPVNETKTNMVAKLDLDAVAIHQMLSMDKYGIGKRIYQEGHNFYDYDNEEDYSFVSLYNLTQSHTIDYTQFPEYRLHEKYLGADFSNQLILQAFDRRDRFESTTAKQRDLAVNIAISSMVSYMAALEALYYSIFRCESDIKASQTAFDGGVALLIGSVEGRERGGSAYQEGRMFYSVGKRACEHFHSCRASDAEVNLELFRAIEEGQTFLKEGNCVAASKAVEAINSLLKVPLVQSLLYFSDSTIATESDDDAAAYVAAMAVLPTLNSINSTSADSIKTAMDFTLSTQPSSDSKMEVVQSSLSDVFASPEAQGVVDCELVTKIEDICFRPVVDNPDTVEDESKVELIKQKEPMPISNGLYVSNNYVGDRSSIALDIQEIEERLKASDFDEATHYYSKGLNSKVYSENGIPTGEVRAVARFSTESGSTMKGDPTYNLFIYGLSDSNHEFLGKPATMYADSFISDMLYLEQQEASKAMVAVTIWMQVAHSLHSAYGACKNSFLTDGRSSDGRRLQTNDPGLMLDEAAAYWIGDNQDTGSSLKGHLLYALTEFISNKFERTPAESESNINTRIIDLFNKAKNHISISKGCSTSEESHLKLKEVVDELIPLMAVPLLRCLLYYISIDDPVLVKVYSVAVLPLFSACAPSVYNELKDVLIDHDVIDIQKSYIYSKIQSMYSCLGITCSTVGRMVNDDVLQCSDNSGQKSLAGYQYSTLLGRAPLMDVEMRKVEILIENGINHFPEDQELLLGTAYDLYKYGENPGMAKTSLSKIARETNRDIVPTFQAFERYFSNEENYADVLIVSAFRRTGAFEVAFPDQRKRVISFALKYMVTHMAVLEKIYSALGSCKRNSRIDGGNQLDTAAGYFIGSLEGKEDGGSFDGQLIFMLAKRMCVQFQTCSPSNNAEVNERIINLFYAAQGEIETGACESLEKTIGKIENAMIVPLIQATLVSALENEFYFEQGVPEAAEFYPEGYVLAQSILPLVNQVDQTAARDIEDVMVKGFPGPDHYKAADYPKVFRAVQTAVSKMAGVDCKQIGRLSGKGFCPGDDTSYEGISSASSPDVSTVMAMISVSAGLFALY